MIFYEKQCDIVWQGVNSIGHFLKKSISPARNDMKFWNLACKLGYVFAKQGNKKEILHQVPHFIFPIVGLFAVVVPRLLTILCNNNECMKKVVDEINKLIDSTIEINGRDIYSLNYLRNCIMETLRLNHKFMKENIYIHYQISISVVLNHLSY